MRWDDVNARARGLATHLLDRGTLAGLAAAPGWPAFISRVSSLGYSLSGAAMADPAAFDRAVSLVASRRLNLLGRWLSTRGAVLAVVLEDEERRTVRALLRGAAQGASPGARLRAVMPTPQLPVSRLERLAHASSVPELVEDLVRSGHPAGRALQDVLRHAKVPNLQALEWALARLFSERSTRSGPAVGGCGQVVPAPNNRVNDTSATQSDFKDISNSCFIGGRLEAASGFELQRAGWFTCRPWSASGTAPF